MVKLTVIPTLILLWCFSPKTYGFELGRAVIPRQGIQVLVENYGDSAGFLKSLNSESEDNSYAQPQSQKTLDTKKQAINQAGAMLKVNRMTDLQISIRTLKGEGKPSGGPYELTFFDARMPDHNHGMVVQPKISQLDDLHWKVEGFKLHMKGLWQFYLTVKVGKTEEKVSFDLDI